MANKFDEIRNEIMNKTYHYLNDCEYDTLQTASNEICVPIVNAEGDEGYLVVTFKIPKGSRDGEAYDGYAMAEEYKMKCEAKAQKVAEAERKKAEKIERDRKAREEKAKIKAEKLRKEKEE